MNQLRPGTNAARRWHPGLLLFLLAMLLRVIYVANRPLASSYTEAARIAHSLLTTGAFANPYVVPTGPTAHLAPVGVLILTAIYRCFGLGPTSDLASQLCAAFATASLAGLMPWLGRRLGLGLPAGIVAGLIVALPLNVAAEMAPDWEAAYVALCMMVLFAFTIGRLDGDAGEPAAMSIRASAVLGVAWGLSFLLAPTMLPVMLALLAGKIAVRSAEHRRVQLVRAATTGLMAALVCVPWTIRNYRQLGGIMFIRDNLGLELAVANNDRASATELANTISGGYRSHPSVDTAQALLVGQIGELAYNRMRMTEAMGWIRGNRPQFLRLLAARIRQFWFPQTPRPLRDIVVWCITLAAFAGLATLARARPHLAVIALAVLVVFPLVYYPLVSIPRYSHPIWWLRALLAGYGVSAGGPSVAAWLRGRRLATPAI